MSRLVNDARIPARAPRRKPADSRERIPANLLNELRAGVSVYIGPKGANRWGVFGRDERKPFATRQKKEAAEALLHAAREQARADTTRPVDPARRACVVITPQRMEGEPAHYSIVESVDLVASHDPTSFQHDPRYPPGVQEREYHRAKGEQGKVVLGSQNLRPDLLLTDTPTAVDGPPLVTAGAPLALGGNGRSMMIKLAYLTRTDAAESYRAALTNKAELFGFTRAEVERMRSPVLVRVMEDVPATGPRDALVAAVRRFNEGLTQQLSAKVRAVAEAKVLRPATIEAIGELLTASGDLSLRQVLEAQPAEIFSIMEKDGILTPQNRASWDAGGKLTDEAKDRTEGMFLGVVIGTGDRLAQSSDELLKKTERMVPYLIRVSAINPALDEIPRVQRAIDLINRARMTHRSLEDLLRQPDMMQAQPDPDTVRMARMIIETGQREIGARFKRWAHRAGQNPAQPRMFEAPPNERDRELLFTPSKAEPMREQNPARPWREVYEQIRRTNPPSMRVVQSPATTTEEVAAVIGPGADGYVIVRRPKGPPILLAFELGKCVQFILDGKRRPALARDLTKDLRRSNPKGGPWAALYQGADTSAAPAWTGPLSKVIKKFGGDAANLSRLRAMGAGEKAVLDLGNGGYWTLTTRAQNPEWAPPGRASQITPLSSSAREALAAFTRDAIRKGAPPLIVRPARQQSLFGGGDDPGAAQPELFGRRSNPRHIDVGAEGFLAGDVIRDSARGIYEPSHVTRVSYLPPGVIKIPTGSRLRALSVPQPQPSRIEVVVIDGPGNGAEFWIDPSWFGSSPDSSHAPFTVK